MTENTIGFRLKTARKTAALSSETAAKRLGIAYPTLNKYENNHRVPGADLIVKMASLYKCEPGALLTDKPIEKKPSTIENPIPVVGKVIDKTNFVFSFDGPFEEYLPLPSSEPGEIFALKVMSNALDGLAYSGEYILFKKQAATESLEVSESFGELSMDLNRNSKIGKIFGIYRRPRAERKGGI